MRSYNALTEDQKKLIDDQTVEKLRSAESQLNELFIHAHDLVRTEGKAATCLENGNIEYWTCSRCNKLYNDAEGNNEYTKEETIIPALGHDWQEPGYNWTPDLSACSALFRCRRCDKAEPVSATISSSALVFSMKAQVSASISFA